VHEVTDTGAPRTIRAAIGKLNRPAGVAIRGGSLFGLKYADRANLAHCLAPFRP
jgi:hypothetical protein